MTISGTEYSIIVSMIIISVTSLPMAMTALNISRPQGVMKNRNEAR